MNGEIELENFEPSASVLTAATPAPKERKLRLDNPVLFELDKVITKLGIICIARLSV